MKKILIFIVAYQAERTVEAVLSRIPRELLARSDCSFEVLVIDDSSQDRTFEKSYRYQCAEKALSITTLWNPVNLGYGGNQKIGYLYALEHGFDIVALVHGDGQYAPEELPRLLEPLLKEECDGVFGSRFLPPNDPLAGGMPLYKYVGNRILSFLQNRLVGTSLSEYHSGYRLYSCRALKEVPFEQNSDGFDFDTDIIIQLHTAGFQIRELSIPTFYGDEICSVNGLQYAARVLTTSFQSALQRFGIFYNRKFDVAKNGECYRSKFHFRSSHSLAIEAVEPGDRLLILGCGPADLLEPFWKKASHITAVDLSVTDKHRKFSHHLVEADIESFDFESLQHEYDKILLLDVIEHLRSPEVFLQKLRHRFSGAAHCFVLTTPNIAFVLVRFMLLLGHFNYGKAGILDRTHTRLFTFSSLRQTLEQEGFLVEKIGGIPAPFPLALGDTLFARALLQLNAWGVLLFRGLFSYQIIVEARAKPTVKQFLEQADVATRSKMRSLEQGEPFA